MPLKQTSSELFPEYRARTRPCGRYAPSPSGPLHLGNARTALLAWLQARLAGATMVLRMEDLDKPRTKPGSAAQILDDLSWLGLDWDEGPDLGGAHGPYDQSARDPLYARAFDFLRGRGDLFPCYCTRKDIVEAASAPHHEGKTHLYPGTCRHLTPADEPPPERADRVPAWRYRVDDRETALEDVIAGRFSQRLERDVGDFAVRRRDGLFAYQLAVVVDDILMGITDVVRGADLLDSTPRQIALFEALGYPPPRFWHVPLMLNEDGKRMSKRDGSTSIAELRERGVRPEGLVGMLAGTLGLVPEDTAISARALCDALTLDGLTASLRARAQA